MHDFRKMSNLIRWKKQCWCNFSSVNRYIGLQTKFKSLSRIFLTIWAEYWPKNSYGSHVIIFLYKKDDTMIPCMIILVNCAVICIADLLMIFGLIKQKVVPCLYWTISLIKISCQIHLYTFFCKNFTNQIHDYFSW